MTILELLKYMEIKKELMLDRDYQDVSWQLNKFENNSSFYYDETNNGRKLWLRESGFNSDPLSDFILGGVMFFGEKQEIDIIELRKKLEIQSNVPELKAKYILKTQDFVTILKKERTFVFLEWLDRKNLYVHYSNLNNLYFTIVDIIDSIDNLRGLNNLELAHTLKNELYIVVIDNYTLFYDIMIKYNYPNISSDNIYFFYDDILDIINKIDETSFEKEILQQALKSARKQTSVIFLEGNIEKTIIDNYYFYYLDRVATFQNSAHIIDREDEIEKIFIDNKVSEVIDVRFENSLDSELIQISDCIIGIIREFHKFINTMKNEDSIVNTINEMDEYSKATFYLFSNLISKSEEVSKLLFCSTQPVYTSQLIQFALQCGMLFEKTFNELSREGL